MVRNKVIATAYITNFFFIGAILITAYYMAIYFRLNHGPRPVRSRKPHSRQTNLKIIKSKISPTHHNFDSPLQFPHAGAGLLIESQNRLT